MDIENTNKILNQIPLPPHSLEAERNVLGALLVNGKAAWDKICDLVFANDFYDSQHKALFELISKRIQRGDSIDVLSVYETIKNQKKEKQVGNLEFISNLAMSANYIYVAEYAKIIHSKSLLRSLIKVGNEIAYQAAHFDGNNIGEMLNDAERRILEIEKNSKQTNESFQHISPLLAEVVNMTEEMQIRENKDEVIGISTGFVDLDKMTQGMQRGDLIIVAGRPSMGKTAFALNIAEHVAVNKQLPVAIFSMEMSAVQLAMRLISSVSRVKATNIRTGNLQESDWHNLAAGLGRIHDKPIYIDETAALNPLALRAKARRLVQKLPEKQLGLIVIDYLQLMTGSRTNSNESRATEVSEISRAIKTLARELNVPIIALSQLSRKVEERTDKRPMMSDLRESGAIEQDADVILMMYRAEYYERKAMEANGENLENAPPSPNAGKAEVIIGKQRNGPTGTVNLTFLADLIRFENAVHNFGDSSGGYNEVF